MVNVQREHAHGTEFMELLKAVCFYRREDNEACLVNTRIGHLPFATELEILNFFYEN